MKKSKKVLSIVLSLIVVITSLVGFTTISYAATRSFTSGDLSCTLDQDTGVFTVSGSGRGAGYANSSTKRAPWYNLYRNQIKSVIIENGVIEIGAYWFYNCTNLQTVTIADSVDTIGDCCFRSCTSLQTITLPKNCSWYYKELFLDCTSLKWAIMPESNNTSGYSGKLPEGTFSGCTSLEEVYIGSGHTAIDNKAFYNCRNLHGVIWSSDNITSVGTDALNSVPNSCVFFSQNNALSSWATSYGKVANSLNASCGNGSLSYALDTNDRALRLNFSGNGTMILTPWTNFHYLIKDISFAGTDNSYTITTSAFNGCENLSTVVFNNDCPGTLTIGDSAFLNCTGSTFWLDIPKNCTSVGSFAFNNTNFNWVKIFSPKISIPANAFGTGYARFYGLHDSGAFDFYKAGKANGGNWEYHCLVDADGSVTDPNALHEYITETKEPTCTEKGYDSYYCPYCDSGTVTKNFTPATGHTYVNGSTTTGLVLYDCSVCGQTRLELSPFYLLSNFQQHISHDNDNAAYNQSNYNSAFDLYNDGYINANDFSIINDTAEYYVNQNLTTLYNKRTTVDTSKTYQTIDGFGASGAWWAQGVGRWSDEQIDRVTELLYGESGAGLDIYRYNLGGGSDTATHIGDWRRRAEDFLSPTSNINDASTYDWSADAAAQKVLASVKKANPDFKLTLFSNSAPVSITDNGMAYCSPGANQNLSESNYQSFANYVVNCAEHFIDEGYNVTSVSPINEPEWDWTAWYNKDGTLSANQEGCHFTAEAARTFYNNYMVPSLKASSKLNGKVNLSVWECAQLNHSSSDLYKKFLPNMFSSQASTFGTNYANNNANIRDYCNSLDTHSYWANTSDRNTVASDISGSYYSAIEEVRCTEYCQMTNDGSSGCYNYHTQVGQYTDGNGLGMYYGLALADIIHQDLTILNAVEWDWWTACSGGVYPDGLVYVDYNDPDNIQTAKRLWVMGNYAKFIQEGAKRVEVTTGSAFGKNLKTADTYGDDKINYIEQSAYLNPDGSIVIVYINNSDTDDYTLLNAPGNVGFESYVTDATRDLEKYQSSTVKADKFSSLVAHIPAKSVTTVVVK